MENKEIVEVLREVLEVISEDKSNLEYGYSWKHQFIKELHISKKAKKELGYNEE
jgi:hypothetical protein